MAIERKPLFAASGEPSVEGAEHSFEFGNSTDVGTDEHGAVKLGTNDDGFDPSIHAGRDKRNADGSYTRKRGRRAGNSAAGGNKKARSQAGLSASLDTLSGMLAIVHAGLASVTKTPELNLEKAEADTLAASVANVLEQFDITPDPKATAIVGLVTTAGMIYGPRLYLIQERRKEEREAKKKSADVLTLVTPDPSTLFSFDQPQNPQ